MAYGWRLGLISLVRLTDEQHRDCRRRTGQRTGLNVDLLLIGFSIRRPEMMLLTRRSCEQGARHLELLDLARIWNKEGLALRIEPRSS